MLAAVYNGVNQFELAEYPLRKLNNGEVLIEINYCGVCGTDHHIISGKAHANIPVILGHEFSGVITDKGHNVNDFQIGDKVVVDPNIYCGKCRYCRKGKVQFCENHQALGVTVDGGFAEYVIVPTSQIYLLPNNFDLSIAAFAEPLSCCLRGIEQAEIKPGNTVTIIGGGSIGLLMVQLVKLSGAAKIILVEPIESRKQIGLKLGADIAFSPDDKNLVKSIFDYTDGGTDVAIECVGKSETVELSLKLIAKGGTIVVFGLAAKDEVIELNLQELFRNEIKIHNSFLNPFTFDAAVKLLVSGRINLNGIPTSKIQLKDIKDIFNRVDHTRIIKSQVTNKNKEE